jgi:hypothetical protein
MAGRRRRAYRTGIERFKTPAYSSDILSKTSCHVSFGLTKPPRLTKYRYINPINNGYAKKKKKKTTDFESLNYICSLEILRTLNQMF